MEFNPFSLSGKTILVTGASSGIGRGIAVTCSKMGARIILNGRNVERLNETLGLLSGENHLILPGDLSKQEQIDALATDSPLLNGVVHCAGILKISSVKHLDRSSLEEIINVNEIAPILLTSALLKKRKIQKGSSIVFIASMIGVHVASVGEAPYSTTKASLTGFIKAAAVELASQGTRVNTICPGVVQTDILELRNELFTDDALKEIVKHYPLKRFGTPEDVANGTVFLLSDASSWVTGINLLMDGGFCLL